ncbi:DUF2681 domain-containing protein [Dyadobacter sp. CY261]|uniref:DUF2681 domain-containing protein n=1 Tax=Dyadobacter sp. CY261 TaxID=2907203 RepID=UPI001F356328|nr:DUF2681 domain-containing protein [Dyadobacter sp. CY261]MCF0075433.1 DUF2681 domain-containing protein [Dyadobacter sp. CY261]
MPHFLKLLLYFFGGILAILISYQVGYHRGQSAGKASEQAAQAVTGAKEAIKSQSLREKVENETRNLSNANVDAGLRSGGWMRSDTDR